MIKVNRQTATSLSEDAVRQQILGGGLAPGTKVTEEALARDLSVSRATVRQALTTLTVEGLLTRHPRTRVLEVTRISAADVVDIYRARRVLELAGVEAAAGANEADLLQLRDHVRAMEQAVIDDDISAFVAADARCHSQTVAFCGSRALVDAHAHLMTRLRLAMTRVETVEHDATAGLRAHQEFCDLICERRIEPAKANLASRLDEAERLLLADADQPGLSDDTPTPSARS
ncbi:MAG: GntR family transcriptional regulator [Propionibacteriaceae bacterium]